MPVVMEPGIKPAQDSKNALRRLQLNLRANKKQDNTELLDACGREFNYSACREEYWNPEEFSLLYGTSFWDQASTSERRLLNQLYWVAYYSQIISAEMATIYLNQCAAAGIYVVDDFRVVCDNLDFESSQERAHIDAFSKVSSAVESEVFGERIFSRPLRPYYLETMVYQKTNRLKASYKRLQIQAFSLLASGSPYLGCQYFTVRGLRTLNGKMIQHRLSDTYRQHADPETAPLPSKISYHAPLPSKISYHHFLDESHHFNCSTIISHDLVRMVPAPTAFERWVTNKLIRGCQRDHFYFSTAINGIFWYDPALYRTIYKLFRSKPFGFTEPDAREMLRKCFTMESDALHASEKTHRTAIESYKAYVAGMEVLDEANRDMRLISRNSVEDQLRENRARFRSFKP
jgi:hypothetical protein